MMVLMHRLDKAFDALVLSKLEPDDGMQEALSIMLDDDDMEMPKAHESFFMKLTPKFVACAHMLVAHMS